MILLLLCTMGFCCIGYVFVHRCAPSLSSKSVFLGESSQLLNPPTNETCTSTAASVSVCIGVCCPKYAFAIIFYDSRAATTWMLPPHRSCSIPTDGNEESKTTSILNVALYLTPSNRAVYNNIVEPSPSCSKQTLPYRYYFEVRRSCLS